MLFFHYKGRIFSERAKALLNCFLSMHHCVYKAGGYLPNWRVHISAVFFIETRVYCLCSTRELQGPSFYRPRTHLRDITKDWVFIIYYNNVTKGNYIFIARHYTCLYIKNSPIFCLLGDALLAWLRNLDLYLHPVCGHTAKKSAIL